MSKDSPQAQPKETERCLHCAKPITNIGGVWFHVGEPVSTAMNCQLLANPTRADLPRAAADDELAAVLIAIRDCKNDTKCSVCASIIRHALIRAKSREVKGGESS